MNLQYVSMIIFSDYIFFYLENNRVKIIENKKGGNLMLLYEKKLVVVDVRKKRKFKRNRENLENKERPKIRTFPSQILINITFLYRDKQEQR